MIFLSLYKWLSFFLFSVFGNQLGGNSALWHSKIYLISKDEFNSQEWGFEYHELEEYSEKLSRTLGMKAILYQNLMRSRRRISISCVQI